MRRRRQLPSVSQLVPSAPPDLVHVIDRLIRKPAAERYPSAEAAAADLSDRPNVRFTAAKSPASHSSGTLAPNRMSSGLVAASTLNACRNESTDESANALVHRRVRGADASDCCIRPSHSPSSA